MFAWVLSMYQHPNKENRIEVQQCPYSTTASREHCACAMVVMAHGHMRAYCRTNIENRLHNKLKKVLTSSGGCKVFLENKLCFQSNYSSERAACTQQALGCVLALAKKQ